MKSVVCLLLLALATGIGSLIVKNYQKTIGALSLKCYQCLEENCKYGECTVSVTDTANDQAVCSKEETEDLHGLSRAFAIFSRSF